MSLELPWQPVDVEGLGPDWASSRLDVFEDDLHKLKEHAGFREQLDGSEILGCAETMGLVAPEPTRGGQARLHAFTPLALRAMARIG